MATSNNGDDEAEQAELSLEASEQLPLIAPTEDVVAFRPQLARWASARAAGTAGVAAAATAALAGAAAPASNFAVSRAFASRDAELAPAADMDSGGGGGGSGSGGGGSPGGRGGDGGGGSGAAGEQLVSPHECGLFATFLSSINAFLPIVRPEQLNGIITREPSSGGGRHGADGPLLTPPDRRSAAAAVTAGGGSGGASSAGSSRTGSSLLAAALPAARSPILRGSAGAERALHPGMPPPPARRRLSPPLWMLGPSPENVSDYARLALVAAAVGLGALVTGDVAAEAYAASARGFLKEVFDEPSEQAAAAAFCLCYYFVFLGEEDRAKPYLAIAHSLCSRLQSVPPNLQLCMEHVLLLHPQSGTGIPKVPLKEAYRLWAVPAHQVLHVVNHTVALLVEVPEDLEYALAMAQPGGPQGGAVISGNRAVALRALVSHLIRCMQLSEREVVARLVCSSLAALLLAVLGDREKAATVAENITLLVEAMPLVVQVMPLCWTSSVSAALLLVLLGRQNTYARIHAVLSRRANITAATACPGGLPPAGSSAEDYLSRRGPPSFPSRLVPRVSADSPLLAAGAPPRLSPTTAAAAAAAAAAAGATAASSLPRAPAAGSDTQSPPGGGGSWGGGRGSRAGGGRGSRRGRGRAGRVSKAAGGNGEAPAPTVKGRRAIVVKNLTSITSVTPSVTSVTPSVTSVTPTTRGPTSVGEPYGLTAGAPPASGGTCAALPFGGDAAAGAVSLAPFPPPVSPAFVSAAEAATGNHLPPWQRPPGGDSEGRGDNQSAAAAAVSAEDWEQQEWEQQDWEQRQEWVHESWRHQQQMQQMLMRQANFRSPLPPQQQRQLQEQLPQHRQTLRPSLPQQPSPQQSRHLQQSQREQHPYVDQGAPTKASPSQPALPLRTAVDAAAGRAPQARAEAAAPRQQHFRSDIPVRRRNKDHYAQEANRKQAPLPRRPPPSPRGLAAAAAEACEQKQPSPLPIPRPQPRGKKRGAPPEEREEREVSTSSFEPAADSEKPSAEGLEDGAFFLGAGPLMMPPQKGFAVRKTGAGAEQGRVDFGRPRRFAAAASSDSGSGDAGSFDAGAGSQSDGSGPTSAGAAAAGEGGASASAAGIASDDTSDFVSAFGDGSVGFAAGSGEGAASMGMEEGDDSWFEGEHDDVLALLAGEQLFVDPSPTDSEPGASNGEGGGEGGSERHF